MQPHYVQFPLLCADHLYVCDSLLSHGQLAFPIGVQTGREV